MRQASAGPATVRVRSGVGTAVVLWRGDPEEMGREHYVEWTVDEDLAWTGNTWPVASFSPALGADGDQNAFRVRLSLTGDGAAVLEVADAQILFGIAEPPPPDAADGTWAEVHVGRDSVSLWPYEV